jgi:GDP-L-fucose synthase
MKKTVLFGSSGMLGAAIKHTCQNSILCPSSNQVNLMDLESIIKYLKQEKPDSVINVAALVAGILANRASPYDFYFKNQIMLLNVLHACLDLRIAYLLTCSSTCAYPNICNNYPMKELDMFGGNPSDDNLGYGLAKRNIISAVQLANKQFGSQYGVIVPSNLYGPGDRHYGSSSAHYITNLIFKLINRQEKKSIIIGGTGRSLRQFTYVYDVARAISLMVDNSDNEVLNCASPENLSIIELAQKTIEANSLNVTIDLDTSFPDGQFRKDVSSEKLTKKYNFEFTKFSQGIKETYEWYNTFGEKHHI